MAALDRTIRSYSIPEIQGWIEYWQDAQPGDLGMSASDLAEWQAARREQIAAGGSTEFNVRELVDVDGTTHIGADYGDPPHLGEAFDRAASVEIELRAGEVSVRIASNPAGAAVDVSVINEDLPSLVTALKTVFQDFIDPDKLPAPQTAFRVFIAHGRSKQWEVVRDFVSAEYDVAAFETDDRTSEATLNVVERMIAESHAAIIVLTGEDETTDGRKLARQNVVHEMGFAHGLLGISNTIVMLENGAEEPSNFAGFTQVRFERGEVHTKRQEILASLANRKRRRDG